MSLTRKEFEEIADIIATLRSVWPNDKCAEYAEQRLKIMCKEHGANFNPKIFDKRINELHNALNNDAAG